MVPLARGAPPVGPPVDLTGRACRAGDPYPLPEMARFRLVAEKSELWAEARSSLHPVRLHTAGLSGVVEAELGGGKPTLGMPTHVELEARWLRSGNRLVDGEMERRLDPRSHPTIRAELTEVASGSTPGTLRLTGALTFHGITRTLEVEVTVREESPTLLIVEGGRAIDIRDFGLQPPSLLLFRMDPRVQVQARLVAMREP